jgi:hypothetical protein
MPTYRLALAKILWGAGFANTLSVGYRLDNATSGSEPRAGSVFVQSPSGIEDSWIVGTDYVLQCEARWIPQTDTASPLATGWDGASGGRAFLEWARAKNIIRFYPDATGATSIDSYLFEPMQGLPTPEADGQRRLAFKIRNATTPYDGW